MSNRYGPSGRHADKLGRIAKQVRPPDASAGPDTCAVCGEDIPDTEATPLPLTLPPGAVEYLGNRDDIEPPEQVDAIVLQLCSSHWATLDSWAGDPMAVALDTFNGSDVEFQPRDELADSETWGQTRLRLARALVAGEREPMADNDTLERYERLQATLLVAAVDRYQIDYDDTQEAKHELVDELSTAGFSPALRTDPYIDVALTVGDEDVVGTVYTISADDLRAGPLPDRPNGPERSVPWMAYYRLTRSSHHESVRETHPEATYVAFYRFNGQWYWYPIPTDLNASSDSADRLYLPLDGPGGESPLLGIKDLGQATLDREEYERQTAENWSTVASNRPLLTRLVEYVKQKLSA